MAVIAGDNHDNILLGTSDPDDFRPGGGRDIMTGFAGNEHFRFPFGANSPEVAEARRGIYDQITDYAYSGVGGDFEEKISVQGFWRFDDLDSQHFRLNDAVRAVEDASGDFALLQVDYDWRLGGTDWITVAQLDGLQSGDTIGIAHSINLSGLTFTAPISVHEFTPGWDALAFDDFNGDSKSDVLWRHDTGEVYIWHMEGTHTDGVSLGAIDNAWRVAASADFNGDGAAEILWRHVNGEVLQNGVSRGVIDNAWRIEGAADFNGDGADEILWRHVNGEVLIDGVSLGIIENVWSIAGSGDFDGDGKAEILWTHDDGRLQLNGVSLSSGLLSHSRRLEDISDYNGDGTSDILLRHGGSSAGSSTGEVFVWQMEGTNIRQASLGFFAHDWEIEGAGDFDGDGQNEIFWRNENGQIQLDGISLGHVTQSVQDYDLI